MLGVDANEGIELVTLSSSVCLTWLLDSDGMAIEGSHLDFEYKELLSFISIPGLALIKIVLKIHLYHSYLFINKSIFQIMALIKRPNILRPVNRATIKKFVSSYPLTEVLINSKSLNHQQFVL